MGVDINPANIIPSFSSFSIIYCGMIIGVVLFPLLIMKQINFLIKINSYGVYFVSVLIGYIFFTGFKSMLNTTFDFQYIINKDASVAEPRHLYLFGDNASMLAGSLTMGYFSHSFVLSVMKNNENQENNKRDLFYGYCLVCLTFVLIGLLGYVGFSGKNFIPIFQDVSNYIKINIHPIIL
jgi:sodium-coupled neutral amino acid transporter 9